MKVFYNSKLAKALTFMKGFETMMLFGAVITEKSELSGKTLKHEESHVQQYQDCVGLGIVLGVAVMFTLFALDVRSLWMLTLALVPPLFFYLLYGGEYVYWLCRGLSRHEAYRQISFERQARWIAETWNLPCEQRHRYESLGWWKVA